MKSDRKQVLRAVYKEGRPLPLTLGYTSTSASTSASYFNLDPPQLYLESSLSPSSVSESHQHSSHMQSHHQRIIANMNKLHS